LERGRQQIDGHDRCEVKNVLVDNFGRIAKKLRISDRQVQYALSYPEITRLVSILADLGIQRIRLTGGEPPMRPNLENLIVALAKIKGIEPISMTTNGILFGEKARASKEAGLEGVNISLDTFKPARFKEITGINSFYKVIEAIKAVERVGLNVKINTVVIRGWNDDEIVDFANFARGTGHVVRFIEFMPLDGSGVWQADLVLY
jgi:GTP 3',8-cyclase